MEFFDLIWLQKGSESTWSNIEKLPTVLQEGLVPIREHRECKNKYGPNYFEHENICVGGRGIIARDGDSGGPLTCMRLIDKGSKNVVVPVLHGISSYSALKTSTRLPSVYTQVSFHMKFITETMEEYGIEETQFEENLSSRNHDTIGQRILPSIVEKRRKCLSFYYSRIQCFPDLFRKLDSLIDFCGHESKTNRRMHCLYCNS